MIKASSLRSKAGILLCFFLTACNFNDTTYHSFQSVNPKGWSIEDTLTYDVSITKEQCLICELELRHLAYYKYKDLKLSLQQNFKDSTQKEINTLTIRLANDKGHWLGVGLGSIFQIKDTFRISKIQAIGNYQIKISHKMKNPIIKGVHDIGIRITSLNSSSSCSINSKKDKK